MAKTKKNVQKKRRQLRKKTRDGRGKKTATTYARREARNSYRPTYYDVMLGDDNSVFSHLFEEKPRGDDSSNVPYDLSAAINEYRNLPELDDYPIKVLNAWNYEVKTNPDGTKYIFVPRRTTQTNNFRTGEITVTPVKSRYT
jgi:hypothetical protein